MNRDDRMVTSGSLWMVGVFVFSVGKKPSSLRICQQDWFGWAIFTSKDQVFREYCLVMGNQNTLLLDVCFWWFFGPQISDPWRIQVGVFLLKTCL